MPNDLIGALFDTLQARETIQREQGQQAQRGDGTQASARRTAGRIGLWSTHHEKISKAEEIRTTLQNFGIHNPRKIQDARSTSPEHRWRRPATVPHPPTDLSGLIAPLQRRPDPIAASTSVGVNCTPSARAIVWLPGRALGRPAALRISRSLPENLEVLGQRIRWTRGALSKSRRRGGQPVAPASAGPGGRSSHAP